jgi:hypothetical protein
MDVATAALIVYGRWRGAGSNGKREETLANVTVSGRE